MRFGGFKPKLLAVKVGSNFEKKLDGEGAVKKMLRPQFCDLGPEIESAHKKHGWLHADSISRPKSQNCVRNIFFYVFADGAKISKPSDFGQQ